MGNVSVAQNNLPATSNTTLKHDSKLDGNHTNESMAEMSELGCRPGQPGRRCCSKCAGHFCSPYSGQCHNTKAKPHYLYCGASHQVPRPPHARDPHHHHHHGAPPPRGPAYVPVPVPYPVTYPTTPLPQLVSIRCADGTHVMCPYGTQYCTYNSELYCAGHRVAPPPSTTPFPSPHPWWPIPSPAPGIVGGAEVIKCLDGRTVMCHGGTLGCANGS